MNLLGSALVNARDASTAIASALGDRLLLTRRLDDVDDTPGSLHALSLEECREVLRAGVIGRFAYVARAGVPDVVPVNYVLDGTDVLLRSGPGPKLQAAERREMVAFEVDEIDVDAHTGRSVVVVGRATVLRPSQQAEVLPWAGGPRRSVIRIRPTRVTGRRLS
jgi:hypothetical protein